MSKGPISIGAILLIAGIADHAYAAPKAALCGSNIGEFGQALDPSLAKDCSTYTTMEHATGWLIGGGIALLAIGIIWFIVAAGIIGAEMNRDRKKKTGAKSPQARPAAAAPSWTTSAPAATGPSAPAAPPGPAPASFGTSAPFATPAPFGPFGEPADPNTRA
jgi:hypothetical protein